MPLKPYYVRTGIWTGVLIVLSVLGMWYVFAHSTPGPDQDARAESLGQGVGFIGGVGYVLIWLPWFTDFVRRRRQ